MWCLRLWHRHHRDAKRVGILCIIVCLLILSPTREVLAGVTVEPVMVIIDHVDSRSGFATYTVQEVSGKQGPFALDKDVILLTEPVKSEVTVIIRNANHVLFVYSKGETRSEPTSNAAALADFAKAVKAFGASPPPKPSGSSPQKDAVVCESHFLKVGDIDVVALRDDINGLVEVDKDLRDAVRSTTSGKFDEAKDKAGNVAERLSRLKGELAKLDGLLLPPNVGRKIKYEYEYCINGSKNSTQGEKGFFELQSIKDCANFPENLKGSLDLLVFLYLDRQRFTDYLNQADELVKAITSSGGDQQIATVAVQPDNIVTQEFNIAPNKKFDAFLDDEAKSYREKKVGKGKYAIVIRPKESFQVSIAPGAFYSFVRNPEFKASQQGANLVVSQTSNDYNAISGMVALNITPSVWAGQLFQPHIQVGIAPDTDKLAFILGAGFHALKQFSFSFGAVYQKATQLKGGLSVGQVVASPDQVQTEKKFKAGLYIGVDYQLK